MAAAAWLGTTVPCAAAWPAAAMSPVLTSNPVRSAPSTPRAAMPAHSSSSAPTVSVGAPPPRTDALVSDCGAWRRGSSASCVWPVHRGAGLVAGAPPPVRGGQHPPAVRPSSHASSSRESSVGASPRPSRASFGISCSDSALSLAAQVPSRRSLPAALSATPEKLTHLRATLTASPSQASQPATPQPSTPVRLTPSASATTLPVTGSPMMPTASFELPMRPVSPTGTPIRATQPRLVEHSPACSPSPASRAASPSPRRGMTGRQVATLAFVADPEDPVQLSLREGDIIEKVCMHPSGWTYGKIVGSIGKESRPQLVGWFPESCLTHIPIEMPSARKHAISDVTDFTRTRSDTASSCTTIFYDSASSNGFTDSARPSSGAECGNGVKATNGCMIQGIGGRCTASRSSIRTRPRHNQLGAAEQAAKRVETAARLWSTLDTQERRCAADAFSQGGKNKQAVSSQLGLLRAKKAAAAQALREAQARARAIAHEPEVPATPESMRAPRRQKAPACVPQSAPPTTASPRSASPRSGGRMQGRATSPSRGSATASPRNLAAWPVRNSSPRRWPSPNIASAPNTSLPPPKKTSVLPAPTRQQAMTSTLRLPKSMCQLLSVPSSPPQTASSRVERRESKQCRQSSCDSLCRQSSHVSAAASAVLLSPPRSMRSPDRMRSEATEYLGIDKSPASTAATEPPSSPCPVGDYRIHVKNALLSSNATSWSGTYEAEDEELRDAQKAFEESVSAVTASERRVQELRRAVEEVAVEGTSESFASVAFPLVLELAEDMEACGGLPSIMDDQDAQVVIQESRLQDDRRTVNVLQLAEELPNRWQHFTQDERDQLLKLMSTRCDEDSSAARAG